MKAYQCSKCENLQDYDESCQCLEGIDPRPNHRVKGDTKLCKKEFRPLEEKQRWHKSFSWESEGK